MPFELVIQRPRPAPPGGNPEEVLRRADAMFQEAQARDLGEIIAQKIEGLRHYDVLGMESVAAILMWGRSGSLLLASYLDGHEDVIMLPELSGQRLYEFWERYQSLPWQDKLTAYAAFEDDYPKFFNERESTICPVQYYAAVQAILELYSNWPVDFLESRRAFFLFVHIAYNLALGRQPTSPRPLMVYAQHSWDDVRAKQLMEDFPQSKFIHTVRDPISSADAVFHYNLKIVEHHILLPYSALFNMTNKDRPHAGLESRTRAVRLEDLHCNIAETMGDLAEWLGLSYQPALLESTFNGIPYVMKRDGKAWSGQRAEQAQRHSRHQSRKDQTLLFSVFYENFVEWRYPCPEIFRFLLLRCIVFLALFSLPMKMEVTAARVVFRRTILPLLRSGEILPAIRFLCAIVFCRLKIMSLLTFTFLSRCFRRTTLLQFETKKQSPEGHGDTKQPVRSEA